MNIYAHTRTPEQVIEQLKEYFQLDSYQFSMNITMFLSGPTNKKLRQQIVEKITGEKMPASKCGITAVQLALTKQFSQHTLF